MRHRFSVLGVRDTRVFLFGRHSLGDGFVIGELYLGSKRRARGEAERLADFRCIRRHFRRFDYRDLFFGEKLRQFMLDCNFRCMPHHLTLPIYRNDTVDGCLADAKSVELGTLLYFPQRFIAVMRKALSAYLSAHDCLPRALVARHFCILCV